MSWILEARARLAQPPPRRLEGEAAQRAVILLPLFVEAGELWILFGETEDGESVLPGRPLQGDEDAWEAARGAAADLGLHPQTVLPLGELDELGSATDRLQAFVAAIPVPDEGTPRRGRFALPLRALTAPSLVEEREGPQGATLRVLHVGRRRLWGVHLWVLEQLLERLGYTQAR